MSEPSWRQLNTDLYGISQLLFNHREPGRHPACSIYDPDDGVGVVSPPALLLRSGSNTPGVCAIERTTYRVEKRDCAAEEKFVRMRIEPLDGVERLGFDLSARRLDVFHTGNALDITAALALAGNVATLVIQRRAQSGESHVEAESSPLTTSRWTRS